MKRSFLLKFMIYIGIFAITISILILKINTSDYYTYSIHPRENKTKSVSTLEKQFTQLKKAYSNSIFSKDSNYIFISLDENLIHFDFDSYILKASEQHVLKPIISNIELDNAIEIIGHTCNMGSIDYNQKLSESRANAVKNI